MVRGRRLKEMKWKSKGRRLGRVSSVSTKSQPVVGRQRAAVERSRAGEKQGPVGAGCWERDRRWKRNRSPGVVMLRLSMLPSEAGGEEGSQVPPCLHSRASRASRFPALESGRYFEEGGLGGGLVETENESSTLLAPFSRGDLREFCPGSWGKPIFHHVADLDHSYKF